MSRVQFRPETLVEMALELAVSLNLPDLVQASAARVREIFCADAVIVGLAHNASIEAVLMQTADGVVSERKSLRRFTPALSAVALSTTQSIHATPAAALLGADLLLDLRWKDLLVLRLTGS